MYMHFDQLLFSQGEKLFAKCHFFVSQQMIGFPLIENAYGSKEFESMETVIQNGGGAVHNSIEDLRSYER